MSSYEKQVRDKITSTFGGISGITCAVRDMDGEEPVQLAQYPAAVVGRMRFEESPWLQSEGMTFEDVSVPVRYITADYSSGTAAEFAVVEGCQTLRNALLSLSTTYLNLGLNFVMPGSLNFGETEVLSRFPRGEAQFEVRARLCFDPTAR